LKGTVFLLSLFFYAASLAAQQPSRVETKIDSTFSKEVVVTGSMKEMRKDELAIPVQIYDADYFQKQNVSNLQDAMRMISGIQPNIDGSLDGAGDIEINGQEGVYTLVLLDGVPISGGNATVYALSGIPLSIIDRIEVMQGPASTIYGTDAVAGVINVITKSVGKANRFSSEVSLNSYLETNAELSFKVNAGKVNGLFALSNFNQPRAWDLNNDKYLDMPLQNRFSFFSKWTVRNRFQKPSNAWFRYTNDRRDGGESDFSAKYRGSDYIYGESIRLNRYEAAGNFALPFATENVSLITSFTAQDLNSFYGLKSFVSNEQNAQVQLVYDKKVASKSDLMVGASYRFYRFNDNQPGTFDTVSGHNTDKPFINHSPAVFLQDMIHVNVQNEILAGIRVEYTTANKGYAICPRFDYKWMSVNKVSSVRLGLGSGFRAPNLFADDRIGYTQGKKIVFGDGLKNELAYGIHLHYEMKQQVKQQRIRFEARAFFNSIVNKIEAELEDDNETVVISNDSTHVLYYGLQTNLEVRYAIPFYTRIGATFQQSYLLRKTVAETSFEQMINAPALNATFDIGYDNERKGVLLSVNGVINSPMHLRVQENDTRAAVSPWFCIMNVMLEKRFKNGLSIRVGANNLLNFKPKNIFLRPNDPFNYNAADPLNNPNGNRFDASYSYSSMKGIHGFIALKYILQ
jgi:outer membrane receptor for ferrienterochelin and colicins